MGNFFLFYFADLPGPSRFSIPHSVSLDEKNSRLYVADRENGRVVVFDTKTRVPLTVFKEFGERVFALHYCSYRGEQRTIFHITML